MSGPGRPRSEAARGAVLGAALELVEEGGYPALTMEGIARRAAVSKQTIYRWWPNKAAIVLEALNEGAAAIAPLPDAGTLAEELRVFVRRSVLGGRGRTAQLLVALMAEAQLDESFARSFRDGFLAQRRGVMVELLSRAQARGEIGTEEDLELIAEVFFGALWYRLLAASGPVNRRFADELAELLMVLLAERNRPARG
ncbi:MAG TPA: TetR/AcrR family transcriptional regulator [Solirubrobacterales bacterium]